MSRRNCTIEDDIENCICEGEGWSEWSEDDEYCHYFHIEKYDTIQFKVRVRTEPALETLRSEVVENCEYAYENDHKDTFGGVEVESSTANSLHGGLLGLVVAAASSMMLAQRTKDTSAFR